MFCLLTFMFPFSESSLLQARVPDLLYDLFLTDDLATVWSSSCAVAGHSLPKSSFVPESDIMFQKNVTHAGDTHELNTVEINADTVLDVAEKPRLCGKPPTCIISGG
jgi:hypothetical protein